MRNYTTGDDNCVTQEDLKDAKKAAKHLGIKEFLIFDFQEEFHQFVVDYIYEGYKK